MKVGIITFHMPYNYGAILQTYATQKIFDDLEIQNEILDFRRSTQFEYYNRLYPKRQGVKSTIKNALMLPFHFERKCRADKINSFINNNLAKSERIYKDENELESAGNLYDIYFTGSDQVWNPTKKADVSTAYFLDFVADEKKRFAYAPSIGIAEISDLEPYKALLDKYERISCREQRGADVLTELLGIDVPVVLDPTLLVNTKHLKKLVKKEKPEPYIFYYSLDGFDKRTRNMDILSYFSKRYGYKVKLITPEWLYHFRIGQQIADAGIEDFLSLIYNAEFVCTTSFHGTALSLSFGKPFYVLEKRGGKDDRKQGLLKELEIDDRIISNLDEAKKVNDYHMDYGIVNKRLDELREYSLNYLQDCLGLV